MEPQFVTELQGEEATSCSVGASHAAVCTSGGDVFVWGHNLAGQLGLTDFQKRPLPTILTYFETDDDIRVRSRRPTSVPSLQYDSCPSQNEVGGLFLDSEPFRTASSDRDAPRRCGRWSAARTTAAV